MAHSSSQDLPLPLKTVHHHAKLYHEFLQEQTSLTDSSIDLIISFNAGIWGYDSWKPTLQYLRVAHETTKKKIPLVVTAYTLWEAQEDYKVLQETFAQSFSLAWKPQLNPFGSHMTRPTSTAPPQQTEAYRENAAWQAWRV